MSVHALDNTEHLDVLIIGAGLSGIGAAYYLQRDQPNKSFAILESRGASGGTWDLFRYPGIRSDSDLHTFGYEFKPWVNDKAIADGAEILAYLRETARENGIDRKIRYHQKVVSASWSSDTARWLVEVEHTETGHVHHFACKWLLSAAGYYRYDQGFTPKFEGSERFQGQIIHPQHWPEQLDYRGKRVVVIGSGATAVTLIPSMARDAAHVTMLQRTPTYVMSLPAKDPIANFARKVMPADTAYAFARRKNIGLQRGIWRFAMKYPNASRKIIRFFNKQALPKDFPVDEHFNPPYNPWEQRLCAVPNGDLFKVIKRGKASVITDHIASFTEKGILLKSGRELEADIIVTATGLNLQVFGGVSLTVDGQAVDMSEKVAFKGMMLSDVPNFSFIVGYTNSSWTLKVGLLCEHMCRVLTHMDRHGYNKVQPRLADPQMPTRPLLDFGAGYVQRALKWLPRQGTQGPWVMAMDPNHDAKVLRDGPVQDACLHFEHTVAEKALASSVLRRAAHG